MKLFTQNYVHAIQKIVTYVLIKYTLGMHVLAH